MVSPSCPSSCFLPFCGGGFHKPYMNNFAIHVNKANHRRAKGTKKCVAIKTFFSLPNCDAMRPIKNRTVIVSVSFFWESSLSIIQNSHQPGFAGSCCSPLITFKVAPYSCTDFTFTHQSLCPGPYPSRTGNLEPEYTPQPMRDVQALLVAHAEVG